MACNSTNCEGLAVAAAVSFTPLLEWVSTGAGCRRFLRTFHGMESRSKEWVNTAADWQSHRQMTGAPGAPQAPPAGGPAWTVAAVGAHAPRPPDLFTSVSKFSSNLCRVLHQDSALAQGP